MVRFTKLLPITIHAGIVSRRYRAHSGRRRKGNNADLAEFPREKMLREYGRLHQDLYDRHSYDVVGHVTVKYRRRDRARKRDLTREEETFNIIVRMPQESKTLYIRGRDKIYFLRRLVSRQFGIQRGIDIQLWYRGELLEDENEDDDTSLKVEDYGIEELAVIKAEIFYFPNLKLPKAIV